MHAQCAKMQSFGERTYGGRRRNSGWLLTLFIILGRAVNLTDALRQTPFYTIYKHAYADKNTMSLARIVHLYSNLILED